MARRLAITLPASACCPRRPDHRTHCVFAGHSTRPPGASARTWALRHRGATGPLSASGHRSAGAGCANPLPTCAGRRTLAARPTRNTVLPALRGSLTESGQRSGFSAGWRVLAGSSHWRATCSRTCRGEKRQSSAASRRIGSFGTPSLLVPGGAAQIDHTDGFRFALSNGESANFRAPGNAPNPDETSRRQATSRRPNMNSLPQGIAQAFCWRFACQRSDVTLACGRIKGAAGSGRLPLNA